MKIRKNAKNSLLTALVCLSLSTGTAWAMPQGGKVVVGDITGITDGTVANGGTINVNTSGLIDWQSFNIRPDEALNFAFASGNLEVINHVIGEGSGNISNLLGKLSSTGDGHITLIT